MQHYDYLVVGAGLSGATFAERIRAAGKSVLVLEKRNHVAGNAHTKQIEGIQVHCYGPHIFHTNSKEVWNYVNRFAEFNRFTNMPLASYRGKLYSLPFNMHTFYQMWGVTTPGQAREIIQNQRKMAGVKKPRNLEEQAVALVGTDIYEALVKGYTEKQWGRSCSELPAFIIKRLPVRFTFDNNYYDAKYQGIPTGGYTAMVERMLSAVDVRLNTDYLKDRERWNKTADRIIYTGPIDAFFSYCYGPLAYRGLRFEIDVLETDNYQGNAVINYTDKDIPYTRVIEHKHFEFGTQPKSVLSREYSVNWKMGDEPYYPINDEENMTLYKRYKELAEKEGRVVFAGRLGEYQYYDMNEAIGKAIELANLQEKL